MKRVAIVVGAVLGALLLSNLSVGQSCRDGFAIADVTLIPMTDDTILEHQTIVISGDRIVQVGPTSSTTAANTLGLDGACIIDGQGQFLMPGLVDAHAHLLDDGDLNLYLAHGVTSIFNMGGSYQHLWMRDALLAGNLDGPSLYTVGPTVKMSAQPLVEFEDNPLNPEFAEELVRRHHAAGYDFLKVWGTFDTVVYAAMMDTARELDFPVTGHIPRDVGLDSILEQGQVSIAHVEELFSRHFNDAPTAEGIAEVTRQLADSGVTVTTTLVTYEAIAASIAEDTTPLMSRDGIEFMDPARLGMWAPGGNRYRTEGRLGRDAHYLDQMAQMQEITLALSEGGVRLLAGVDAGELPGLVPGLDLHRELELMVQAGIPNEDVLRAATRNFGTYLVDMGVETDFIGVIEEGARADLLLLNANPLEDISNTREIASVISRGEYYDRATLEGLTSGLVARNAATTQYFGALASDGTGGGAAHIANWSNEETPPFGYFPSVFFAFGQAQQGDVVGAEATLLQIAEVYPDRPESWLIVAGLRSMVGNTDGAMDAYDETLRLAPEHERAQRDREQLVRAIESGN